MLEFLFDVKRTIRSLLTADINSYAASENVQVLLAMLPFGILFGVAHASTRGVTAKPFLQAMCWDQSIWFRAGHS
jgi:hypothetical protein